MSDDELFAWTSLLSARTGLPVTVWVSAAGLVATDPCDPANAWRTAMRSKPGWI